MGKGWLSILRLTKPRLVNDGLKTEKEAVSNRSNITPLNTESTASQILRTSVQYSDPLVTKLSEFLQSHASPPSVTC